MARVPSSKIFREISKYELRANINVRVGKITTCICQRSAKEVGSGQGIHAHQPLLS